MRINKHVKFVSLVIIIIILVLITAISSKNIYHAVSNHENRGIEQLSQSASENISSLLTCDLKFLEISSQEFIDKNLDQKEINVSNMKDIVDKTGLYLCVLDQNGTGYDYDGNDVSIPNLNQYIGKENGIFFVNDGSNLKDKICFYKQIKNTYNIFYLVEWLPKKDIYTSKNTNIVDLKSHLYIIDSTGNILLTPENTNLQSELTTEEFCKLKSMLLDNNAFSRKVTFNDHKYIICTDSLQRNDWYLSTIVPTETLAHNAQKLFIYIFLICCCFFVTILIIIYYLLLMLRNNISLKLIDESNASKSKFWTHISHEIRTPMNAIVGMAEIAKISLDNREKLLECLVNIENTSEYMLSLVNEVLDMSKINSNKIELNLEPFNVSEIIDTVKLISQSNITKKNIKLSILKSGNLTEIVYGDKNRLKQILVNLVNNATKFTEINGKIKILIKSELISDNSIKYYFEVTDSGIGIKKEKLEKIFEPFEQAESNVSTIYGGTGLGLSICKGYIKLMKGKISVESEYGKGTSFFVELEFPIASKEQKEIYETELLKSKLSKENNDYLIQKCELCHDNTNNQILSILLVDDNEMNLEVITTMLEYYGYRVVKAYNGQEAVDIFDNSALGQFDLILMDVEMPVKNGLEAAAEIRSLNRRDASTVKIIALTANAFKEDILRAQNAGMNFHITKPIKMIDLKEKLDLILQDKIKIE